jgi:hypothetical protein
MSFRLCAATLDDKAQLESLIARSARTLCAPVRHALGDGLDITFVPMKKPG